jgi:hypothetical protein
LAFISARWSIDASVARAVLLLRRGGAIPLVLVEGGLGVGVRARLRVRGWVVLRLVERLGETPKG